MEMDLIEKLSHLERKNLLERLAKLMEEVGELSQEVLITLKASGFAHKKAQPLGIQEETVDVLLVAFSIYFKSGGTQKDLKDMLLKKTKKWQQFQDRLS